MTSSLRNKDNLAEVLHVSSKRLLILSPDAQELGRRSDLSFSDIIYDRRRDIPDDSDLESRNSRSHYSSYFSRTLARNSMPDSCQLDS
ncbi:hypothetical protein TNCT_579711 [Trichonephila clavata]|uniref:Uncharacterized protein n=1 Tax=Trichonephila clavata TaxID=2740835 RepID=A0A8X6G3T0_TRICU|nr:hypothetical protein TNCT_579711 [Trichonephila clavata]